MFVCACLFAGATYFGYTQNSDKVANSSGQSKSASAANVFGEAPQWVKIGVDGLLKAKLEKDNADARNQFGPLYIEGSKIELAEIKSKNCFASEVGASPKWKCSLTGSFILGGKQRQERSVDVILAGREASPSIVSMKMGF